MTNVGLVDKLFRLVFAIFFTYLGYVYNKWFYLVTIILALTIITGFCPLYSALGISTRKRKKPKVKAKIMAYQASTPTKRTLAKRKTAKKRSSKKVKKKTTKKKSSKKKSTKKKASKKSSKKKRR